MLIIGGERSSHWEQQATSRRFNETLHARHPMRLVVSVMVVVMVVVVVVGVGWW